jgi:hypothetical protein
MLRFLLLNFYPIFPPVYIAKAPSANQDHYLNNSKNILSLNLNTIIVNDIIKTKSVINNFLLLYLFSEN